MYVDPKDEADFGLRTVTLSNRDLQAVARVLNLLVSAESSRPKDCAAIDDHILQPASTPIRDVLVDRARHEFANRARRSRIFGGAMFGEAAWDMLLALYVAEQSGARHTVSGLTDLSGVPSTTALRWLDFLENKEQLVRRRANPTDKRVFFVELTDRGRAALDLYFSGTAPSLV